MTDDDWKNHARTAVLAMQSFTAPFVCPISYERPNELPRLSGTGSYIDLFKKKFLLTNQHVLLDEHTKQEKPQLAHGISGTDDVFRMIHGSISVGYPIDSAIYPVPDAVWKATHTGGA
ncbi:hypothetical protein [Acidiphilium acidophilum]|uniref:Uncharacterized protein n=1 Tax=Acidiphilium acidophilum TaxID=76588 RepID=A0AAW9DNX0_ACIAO|nr:hypothetical protein [Acidiphilium acidophilum]MDX5930420.1 hypothetical protein [Acidiphilium acidophilum]GBR74830.1 hypothetical protein AA700_0347 [Acidiphilium acidophilum DSM 700]